MYPLINSIIMILVFFLLNEYIIPLDAWKTALSIKSCILHNLYISILSFIKSSAFKIAKCEFEMLFSKADSSDTKTVYIPVIKVSLKYALAIYIRLYTIHRYTIQVMQANKSCNGQFPDCQSWSYKKSKWSIFIQWIWFMIARWQSYLVNTKERVLHVNFVGGFKEKCNIFSLNNTRLFVEMLTCDLLTLMRTATPFINIYIHYTNQNKIK